MIFGIDLGTSNSLISYLDQGIPVAIPNLFKSALTPSVVSVDGTGSVLVGQAAKERLSTHPGSTIASFKRFMGGSTVTRLGQREFLPEELSALVLKSLKSDAEATLNCAVEDVVISVPAYFNDQQRKATRLAGELAGLKVRRLINEPTAAALLHGIHERDTDAKFLVFDLGGGTFDVSILDRFSGIMEVRATGGDSFLGGDDFTQVMCDVLARKAKINDKQRQDLKVAAALQFAAESVKRRLSQENLLRVTLPSGLCEDELTVGQDEYEQACGALLGRLRAPVERALRDARLRSADLDEIVLVGGATRMPMVRKLVAQLFGRIPARHADPDQTVALGAAVCAGLIARDAAFEELVMTDVCPHTLGTSVVESDGQGGYIQDVFLPIIERNTVVPASRERAVSTVADNQTQLAVKIYQGESRQCSRNMELGQIEVTVPPRKAGEITIQVRYTYDINGILDVDVTSEKFGIAHNLVIKDLAGNISDDEIARRKRELAALKVHPREQTVNRQLLERGERLYEQLLGHEREQVGRWMNQFNAVLERQEPRDIANAATQLTNALDSLERGEVW